MPDARQMYRPASFRGRRCHCSGLICINEAYCVVHAVAVVAGVVAAAADYFERLDASTRNNKLRMLFGYLPFFRRFSRFVSRHF